MDIGCCGHSFDFGFAILGSIILITLMLFGVVLGRVITSVDGEMLIDEVVTK